MSVVSRSIGQRLERENKLAAELATLRARVEELERERDQWRNNFSAMHQQAMRAEARLSEATRLAVEALEPFAGAADTEDEFAREDDNRIWIVQAYGIQLSEIDADDLRRARATLDRLNAMKGESDG